MNVWNLGSARTLSIAAMVIAVSACSGSDDDEADGAIRFYNTSANSPELFIFVEEDLDEDIDDELLLTFNSIDYAEATSRTLIDGGVYEFEISLQEKDSVDRDDLEIIYTGTADIRTDETTLYVIDGDISSPEFLEYKIPIIDDEDDEEDELTNIQLLNVSMAFPSIDVWLSEEDEGFQNADNIGAVTQRQLSENIKLDQEDYVVYLTETGSNEVIFESSAISYNTTSQSIISIRDNPAIAATALTIDNLTNGQIQSFQPQNSAARVRFYNGITINDLEPNYNGIVRIQTGITTLQDSAQLSIEQLEQNAVTASFEVETGDFSVNIIDDFTDTVLIQNQRVTLAENTDKTVFLFAREEFVDDDGDGNFDENGDGIIDEIDVIQNLISVENSRRTRVFDNLVTSINLVDSEDFNNVTIYFVRGDEVIDTTDNRSIVAFADPTSITLLNDTYDVFVIANVDGVEQILDRTTITLDSDTLDQYLLVENVSDGTSEYRVTVFDQVIEE